MDCILLSGHQRQAINRTVYGRAREQEKGGLGVPFYVTVLGVSEDEQLTKYKEYPLAKYSAF